MTSHFWMVQSNETTTVSAATNRPNEKCCFHNSKTAKTITLCTNSRPNIRNVEVSESATVTVKLCAGRKKNPHWVSFFGGRDKVCHNISVCKSLYRLQLLVLCGGASRQHKLYEGRPEESRKFVPREHGRH